MIRQISRWFDRNPLVAVCAGILFCFAALTAARAWDRADTAAIRVQMVSARGGT